MVHAGMAGMREAGFEKKTQNIVFIYITRIIRVILFHAIPTCIFHLRVQSFSLFILSSCEFLFDYLSKFVKLSNKLNAIFDKY